MPIGEINSPDPAVSVDLHPRGLDVIRAVGPTREVTQIELNLIPSAGEPDGHRRAERADARCALEIAHAKPPVHILIVQNLFSTKCSSDHCSLALIDEIYLLFNLQNV